MPVTHVLLVHGINSNAKWQSSIGQVLEPHFHVVKIRYWQYRWLGATKLALEPWAFLVSGIASYWGASRYLAVWEAIAESSISTGGLDARPWLVHNVASPSQTCSSCAPGADAQIHNFDCTGLGHSDTFLGGHAARFWLPFLWRFDPVEYGDLLDCCEAASEAYANSQDHELKVAEDELLNSDWEWAHGTLLSCLRDVVKQDPKLGTRDPEELTGRASRLFWQILDRGRAAAESGEEQEKKWIVYLHPSRALAEAVHEVIEGP